MNGLLQLLRLMWAEVEPKLTHISSALKIPYAFNPYLVLRPL